MGQTASHARGMRRSGSIKSGSAIGRATRSLLSRRAEEITGQATAARASGHARAYQSGDRVPHLVDRLRGPGSGPARAPVADADYPAQRFRDRQRSAARLIPLRRSARCRSSLLAVLEGAAVGSTVCGSESWSACWSPSYARARCDVPRDTGGEAFRPSAPDADSPQFSCGTAWVPTAKATRRERGLGFNARGL